MRFVRSVAIVLLITIAVVFIVPAWLFSFVAKKAATKAQNLLGV